MAQEFFYLDSNNEQKGPLSVDQLKTVGLKPDTLIWVEGFDNWKPAKEVEELKKQLSKTPPPPPITKATPPSPVAVSVATTTVVAKNFRCNGCGASLEIPKNARGNVKCKFCGNDCVLDGIIKNAEIAAKENINSGISLSAAPAKLHRIVVSILSKSSTIPLDVFDKVEIVREEHYCIPAYCFNCNGTVSFTYEVANERSQVYTVDRGDSVETRTRTFTEYAPGNSSTSVIVTLFVSGNKEFIPQIEELYKHLDLNRLDDFENLEFPADTYTYNYNLPHIAAFNEHIVPEVNDMLREDAIHSISRLDYVNFAMGGSRIDKDIVRVFLGLYKIVYKYKDQEYSVWVAGDGAEWWYYLPPKDEQMVIQREQKQRELEKAKAAIPRKKSERWGGLIGGFIPFLSLAIIFFFCAIVNSSSDVASATAFWVFFFLFLAGTIAFGVAGNARKNKAIAYNLEMADKIKEAEQDVKKTFKELESFESQLPNIVKQFNTKKKALRGIYEKVSGDSYAFLDVNELNCKKQEEEEEDEDLKELRLMEEETYKN